MTITVKLPISTPYRDETISLNYGEATLSMPLVDGAHFVTTQALPVGRLCAGGTVEMSLSVWYEYCANRHVLTLCSPQMETTDTTTLSMQLGGEDNLYKFYACPDMQMQFNSEKLRLDGKGMELINQRMTKLLSDVTKLIKEEALCCGLTVQVRTPVPALSDWEEENLKVLFQNNVFAGYAKPGKSYGDDISVLSLGSVWGGYVEFDRGEQFANVIGSTKDPLIDGFSWIRLWENYFGSATKCTSLNYNGFVCRNAIIGGHVISGTHAKIMDYGSNSVYIMPICGLHNTNNNVHMAALEYQNGIWLNNYHQS